MVFGGFVLSPDSPQPFVAEMSDWSRTHFERCSRPGYEPSHQDFPDGNMSAKRKHLLQADGWDESFIGFGGEDDRELAVRLRKLGLRFQFEREALGYHFQTKSWSRFLADTRQTGRAHLYFFTKHPEHIHDLEFARWAGGPWSRRNLFKLANLMPEGFFKWFSSFAALWDEGLNPRHARAVFRLLFKLSAALFYCRGVWDEPHTAAILYQQLGIRVPILCYHRVVPEGMEDCVWTLSIKEFERQMRRLAARGHRRRREGVAEKGLRLLALVGCSRRPIVRPWGSVMGLSPSHRSLLAELPDIPAG